MGQHQQTSTTAPITLVTPNAERERESPSLQAYCYAKAKRSSYGIDDAGSSQDTDNFDNDYASLSLVALNIQSLVTAEEPQLIQQPIQRTTLYPWVAVELNPSDDPVEDLFLASTNPEQMQRLHPRTMLVFTSTGQTFWSRRGQ
ncbi:hypothetical protein JMJ78_0008161 [Colletotrichum scovillei]|nr:hypothetical protein JMJ78_0008161 [Colletotrichum scovillei]